MWYITHIFHGYFTGTVVPLAAEEHIEADKMAAILQTTFSDSYSCMKIVAFSLKFQLK